MILIGLRQGIGFDIEFNDEICYMAETEDDRDVLITFEGAILLLPFIKIHFGNFTEVLELKPK